METSNPSKPDTVVLHSILPDSIEVKTLYEVFSWGREAWGEYLYYGEIDKNGVKPDNTGDLTKANVYAEVNVSFEEDTLDVVSEELQLFSSGSVTEFSLSNELGLQDFASLTPEEIIPHAESPDYTSVIDSGSNWFKIFMVDGYANAIIFRFIKIDGERVTEITVWAQKDGANINWMLEKFTTLCNQYDAIPFNVFSGAPKD